jgi:hypothetical protein
MVPSVPLSPVINTLTPDYRSPIVPSTVLRIGVLESTFILEIVPSKPLIVITSPSTLSMLPRIPPRAKPSAPVALDGLFAPDGAPFVDAWEEAPATDVDAGLAPRVRLKKAPAPNAAPADSPAITTDFHPSGHNSPPSLPVMAVLYIPVRIEVIYPVAVYYGTAANMCRPYDASPGHPLNQV